MNWVETSKRLPNTKDMGGWYKSRPLVIITSNGTRLHSIYHKFDAEPDAFIVVGTAYGLDDVDYWAYKPKEKR